MYIYLIHFFFRNSNRELNDIRFEFLLGKDTPDGIASELVGAGLVDGRDSDIIAMNLRVLIGNQSQDKPVTFALVSIYKIILLVNITTFYFNFLRFLVATVMKHQMRKCLLDLPSYHMQTEHLVTETT